MQISIGILAHNEAGSIHRTLEALAEQSVFQQSASDLQIEIIVVPNGCTDQTAAIATTHLARLFNHLPVSWRVCEIERGGKSNAWNHFVHDFSSPDADYLILMDADIQLYEKQTLQNLAQALETNPSAWVSVDKLIKDIVFKPRKTLMEKLSVSVSQVNGEAGEVWICGHLYCGRASILRKIWFPLDIYSEDGFLWVMIVTDCLTSSPVLNRVVRADAASHIYEAYTELKQLFRHEQCLVASKAINASIFDYLRANMNEHQDAGTLVKQLNERDPQWIRTVVKAATDRKGFWLIEPEFLTRRFKSLRKYSLPKAILFLPVVAIAFFTDLLLYIRANLELYQNHGVGYWGKKQTTDALSTPEVKGVTL